MNNTTSLCTGELGDRICELAAHLNAANCRFLELIAQFDRDEGWGADGCNSCAHWLNWKCGVSLNAARERVRVAHALTILPLIHDSFSEGEISYSKVRAMSRVATSDNESYLLMIATHGTAAHVEFVVRGYRRAKADLELDEANNRHSRRQLNWHFDDDGMVVVKARLTPEDGALFIDAIERAAKQLQADQGEVGDEATALSDEPFEVLRADALLHAVVERADAEVQVIVSAETLRDFDTQGCCQVKNGANLAPHTVRRLSCDAGIVRIVEDGESQVLDVGRKTRSISPALKRALALRDKGCRFPGCAATRRLHGHHIEHWVNGGVTSLDNLVQLCPHHHRLVHEGGYTVRTIPDDIKMGTHSDINTGIYINRVRQPLFRFQRPDGMVIDEAVPQISIDVCAEASLKRLNTQLGLDIDEWTAYPNWDGEPMDRASAIDCMFSASGEFLVANADVSAGGLEVSRGPLGQV
jgi:hypothetical protein